MGKAKAELTDMELATMLARISISAKDIKELHIRRKGNGKYAVSLNTSINELGDSNDKIQTT